MYSYREQLELLKPIRIRDGESKRIDCPFCGGRGTFTLSNIDGRKVWNCYKASCPSSGSVATEMSLDTIKRRLSGTPADASRPLVALPTLLSDPKNHDNVLTYLDKVGSLYAYEQGLIQIKFAPAENRVLFFFHHKLGAVGRALDDRKPKWKAYGDVSGLLSVGSGQVAVLVEDAASACSVARLPLCSGCALLGTSVSVTHKAQLRAYTRVIIALDKDASRKAVELSKKLEGLLDVRIAMLDEDLKYLSIATITRILKL
jgi:hypothetical protein